MTRTIVDAILADAQETAARHLATRLAEPPSPFPLPIRDPAIARLRRRSAPPSALRVGLTLALERAAIRWVGIIGFVAAERVALGALAVLGIYGRGLGTRLAVAIALAAELSMIGAFRLLWTLPIEAVRRRVARRQAFRALAGSTDSPEFRWSVARGAFYARVPRWWIAVAVVINVVVAACVVAIGWHTRIPLLAWPATRWLHILGGAR
jgi:hypothetical protein